MQVPGVAFACASHPVMKETTMSETAQLLLGQVRSHVRTGLRPLVEQIDRQGFYPETWLRELGALGGDELHVGGHAHTHGQLGLAQT